MPKKKKKEVEKDPKKEQKVVDDRAEQLQALYKAAKKKGVKIGYANEYQWGHIPRVTTGVLSLDRSLGGGLPVGRISMFYGPKSSSKTTAFLRAAGRAQRMCSTCWTPAFPIWTPNYEPQEPKCACGEYRQCIVAWCDVEGVWDKKWSERFLNVDDLVFSQPETGEQASDIAHTLVSSGSVDIVVVDSIAFMTPFVELEKSAAEKTVGEQARLIGNTMRRLVSSTNSICQREGRRPSVWFTNQIRMKVGVMFGNPETVSGGLAQGFATSCETRMSPGKYERNTDTDTTLAAIMKFRNEKNKTGPAKMEGEYKLILAKSEVKNVGDVMDEQYARKLGEAAGLVKVGRGRAATEYDGVEYDGVSLLERHWMLHPGEYEMYKARLLETLLAV